MEEIRQSTLDVKNPVNNGLNYQPQLVPDFGHQQLCQFTMKPEVQSCAGPNKLCRQTNIVTSLESSHVQGS